MRISGLIFRATRNQFNKTRRRKFYSETKVHINGYNINFVESGRGENTLFLMPGTMGTALTDFGPQIEKLPKLLNNYKIIAWDPPGYGKSIPPERQFNETVFQEDAKYAVNLMRLLQREKFSILAWSAGGFAALILASWFPQYVDKLVIWGSAAYISKTDIESIHALRDVKNWSEKMREPLMRVYGEERFLKIWEQCVQHFDDIYNKYDGNICREELSNIKAPTFILYGKKDPIISIKHVGYLHNRLPCYRLHEFPEGKHNIHLRYPDDFNGLVAEFLLQNPKELRKIPEKSDIKFKDE